MDEFKSVIDILGNGDDIVMPPPITYPDPLLIVIVLIDAVDSDAKSLLVRVIVSLDVGNEIVCTEEIVT
jgi:hypothetical protein